MKKLVLATTVLGIMATTSAQAEPKFFTQADLGVTSLRFHDHGESFHKNVFSQRLSGGLDFQNGNRLSLGFTHYGRITKDYYDATAKEFGDVYSEKMKFDTYDIGVGYTYTIPLNFPVRPYVGARMGMSIAKSKHEAYAVGYSASHTHTDNRFSFGGLAGVEYDIMPNLAVGIGAEYNRLNSYLNAFSGNGFLRYTF